MLDLHEMIFRHLENELKERFRYVRSLYIFGPRQSGKTTLARAAFPDMPYVTLEDPDIRAFAMDDPRGFLGQFIESGIIDEPQHCPDLFSYLQAEIDIKKKKYILTSSQNFLSMAKISQSLAGRISIVQLLPFSKAEIERRPLPVLHDWNPAKRPFRSLPEYLDLVCFGGYPELWKTPESQRYWYSDYVQTFLERDIRYLMQIQDLGLFGRFLRLTAGRSGSVLNKASLASDCGISEVHCVRWLSILEQSGIIYLLKPFYNNFNKRLIKSPKLYFNDTGLLCYLLSIKQPAQLFTHPLYGHIVETFVVSELRKHYLNRGEDPELYFWRDSHGDEIDLILVDGGDMLPIEIKASQTLHPAMLRPLEKWQVLTGTKRGIVFYGGDLYQQRTGCDVVPIDFF